MMRPVGFYSFVFNQVEKNYFPYNKGMLIIIDYLKKFESYLIGIKFDILTNHMFLTH